MSVVVVCVVFALVADAEVKIDVVGFAVEAHMKAALSAEMEERKVLLFDHGQLAVVRVEVVAGS